MTGVQTCALPISLDDLFSFEIFTMIPSYYTLFNLILISACLSVISALFTRKIRISHLLMFIAGIILLTKGVRFIYECALLSMPVLKSNALVPSISPKRKMSIRSYIVFAVILIVMPFMFFKNVFPHQLKYPFSQKSLPQGITTFLNHIETSGSVLNYPSKGGYLQWMLYPKYKIFMDLEMMFTDEDLYTAQNAFHDENVLRKVLSKYNPSFITVPIENKLFKELIKEFPEYRLVFFDDAEVLYVNSRDHPAVTKQYELKTIDPFMLIGKNIGLLNEKESEAFLKELQRMTEIYPDSGLTNQILAMIYNLKGDYDGAIQYADVIIKNSPELPKGYRVKGDSLTAKKLYEEAIDYYKMAVDRSVEMERLDIYKKMWACYTKDRKSVV